MLRNRLRRMGSRHRPFYRVVVSDSRRVPGAAAVEEVGYYDPSRKPATLELRVDRVDYWVNQGAQPSDTVKRLVRQARSAPAAAPEAPAEAPKTQTKAKKTEDAKAEVPKAEEAKAEAPKAEEAKAEAPKAEEGEAPKAEEAKAEPPKAEEAEAPKAEETAEKDTPAKTEAEDA